MIAGRPDMPDAAKTSGSPRMVVGYCPECNGPRAVRNWYESWPLVYCSCGWRGATTELLHRVRFDPASFAAAEAGPADLQELVATLREQIALFKQAYVEVAERDVPLTGCWVVTTWDMGAKLDAVFPNAEQAIEWMNANRAWAEVRFVSWGEFGRPS